jgi:GDP-L-fucose synthase
VSGFFQDKKVLVTGGTGFVGRHFVMELLRRGARIRIPLHKRPLPFQHPSIETMTADLTRLEDCLRVCGDVDFVVHAAGAVGAAGVSAAGVLSGIAENIVLTVRILEAAFTQKAKRILVFGSSTGYPEADHPLREEEMWDGPPPSVYFGYGWMRRYIELLSKFTADKSGMGIALCRPTAVYGRFDNFDSQTSHVIPALIRRAVERQNPYVVWGSGEEQRDFLHVTDLVRGCLALLEKHAVCDPVNIGFGRAVTIKETVGHILEAAGHTGASVEFDETKPTARPVTRVDTTKAKDILGFVPAISLQEGINDTVAWYGGIRSSKPNPYESFGEVL